MPRDDVQLNVAKRGYRNAKVEGNRQEEARWANVIGDILKNRGEYVEALKWLRIDYEISVKYLPEKHLLPTCQSLGEVYLRLEYFKDALIYQKKHLELAKEANDLVEQQRASTQLGRTYHEMFSRSEDDHYSVRNAKKYFKYAMKLAKALKENPPTNRCSFLKEYVDAHNNLGMLEMDLDNLEEAEKILIKGLEICDEEEVIENDDGRTRLHHNLGNVYMELRMWDEARKHIEKDIRICKKIGHCQGEAKGYINLGELHYKVQKYDDALLCYQKALALAKSMEDEDALARQIDQNIETVKEAVKVMDELKKEEQNLKKLTREMTIAKGTPRERKCLLQQNASLDCLIEKSTMIFAWIKHHEFAKRKKRIARELHDKEKLSDSYLVIGESYQKLRKFKKAIKWYMKSLEMYKSIGNLEGQALAKINIGDVLDCDGMWTEALEAFEESYRIAVEANLPSVQLSALENMHYSYMIRFDNIEEARRLQLLIDQLKQSNERDYEMRHVAEDCCSETDSEENEQLSASVLDASCSPVISRSRNSRSKPKAGVVELNDDITLISLLRSSKTFPKMTSHTHNTSAEELHVSPKSLSKSNSNEQKIIGRKRRVVLSDDEADLLSEELSKGRPLVCPREDVTASSTFQKGSDPGSPAFKIQDAAAMARNCSTRSGDNMEESTSSHKSRSPNLPPTKEDRAFRPSTAKEVILTSDYATSGSKCENNFENLLQYKADHLKLHNFDNDQDTCVAFKIDNMVIHVEAGSLKSSDKMSIESLKNELACLCYLRLPLEKRSEGLLPVIQQISCGGKVLESIETIEADKEHRGKVLVEAVIEGWVSKPLIKLYIDYCRELSETPNMKLLKKLYNLEASDDEVTVSECDLQDLSISPLLNALHTHKTFAVLDLSHNLLGNGTMEKIQQVFTSSGQTHDLTLDLHCNRFGPTALYQICECPVLFSRLQVLNISGNRLTDACGSYISTILKNCKGLWSLNIERCSITSRTIQKVAAALDIGSALEQLSIGYNDPISGSAIINLLVKLATLNRFSRLSLSGLKLNKPIIDSLCQLAKMSCLSEVMVGGTNIGSDGALQLTESLFNGSEEFMKLDFSYCGLTSNYILKLDTYVSHIHRIHELNLTGNDITQEGANAITSLITNPNCCLKVLILNKCQLRLAGVLHIVQSLEGNSCLEELSLADNVDMDHKYHLQNDKAARQSSEISQLSLKSEPFSNLSKELNSTQRGLADVNVDCNQLEVADSEDDLNRIEAATSGIDDSCSSSYQRNPSSPDSGYVQELSAAIFMARTLQVLDLSNNGFLVEAAEELYNTWSNSRTSVACSHIKDQTIHLSVKGIGCCVRPCCVKY